MIPQTVILDNFDNVINELSELYMVVVYTNVSDLPDKYVARLFKSTNTGKLIPTEYAIVAENYDSIYERIPCGLYRIPRYVNDDEVIVEVWI